MRGRAEDQEVLVRYLLGELTDAERTRIELLFFSDEGYYEHLLAVEDELRYDFAQGRLAPARRERFARRFLRAGQDRGDIGFPAALLSRLAARKADAVRSTDEATFRDSEEQGAEGNWARLRARLRAIVAANPMLGGTRFRLAFAATAIILVAVFAAVIQRTIAYHRQLNQMRQELASDRALSGQIEAGNERVEALTEEVDRERSRRIELENEVARQNERIEHMGQKTARAGPILSFVLEPGLTRDSGSIKRLPVPSNTESLRLQMRLSRPGEYRSYKATVRTAEGKFVWSQGRIGRAGSRSGQELALTLPASLAPPGDYEVELTGSRPGAQAEPVETYYFTIVKK